MMTIVEAQRGVISAALEAYCAAVRHLERARKVADQLKSFEQGPVEPVLNPQATDEGGIRGGIERATKILKIDDSASAEWQVDDVEDVRAEVLARVQQRLDQMPIRVLLQLGWNGLRMMAAQELTDVLDKREAKRRGGTGGRKAKKSVQAALHIPFEDLVGDPESPDIPSPPTPILAAASKLGRRAHQYLEAIAAGADQKSAAKVAGISTRMGRKYLQQLRVLLKTEG